MQSGKAMSSGIKINIADPCLGEEEAKAVYDVVKSGWLYEGKKTKEFEDNFAKYTGVKNAVAFFNGTVALHAVLKAYDIGPGDEVIVPSLTFISTATSVIHAGAEPVFCDVTPDTFNMDPKDLEKKITKKTKAVMPVHYAGQPADMDAILEVSRSKGLPVIEDAAEAHGAVYKGKKVGGLGNAGMFSFTPTKNITTGEGGLITTDDDLLAEKLRLLKSHGQDRQYHHVLIGYNYRITEMQSAIGVEQLKKLEGIISVKRRNSATLNSALSGIKGIVTPVVARGCEHVYMMYTIKVIPQEFGATRDELSKWLTENGIQNKVYFPPAHDQLIFKGRKIPALPVTDVIADQVLSLPFHSKITEQDISYIAEKIRDLHEKRK